MARRQVSDNPIPQEYRDLIGNEAEDPAFIAAWEHAAALNNSPKACMLYAQTHAIEFKDQAPSEPETPESLQEQIDRLTAQKEALETDAT